MVCPRRTATGSGSFLTVLQPSPYSASVSRSCGAHFAASAPCWAAASASADSRRTVTTRWTSVTRLAGGDDPQRDRQQPLDARHAERVQARETGRDQRDHQPLGALHEAVDGDRQPDGLAARLGVRHHLPARETEDRHGAQDVVVPVARVPEGEAAEDGAVRDPVEGGVQEGSPAAGTAQLAAMLPSTRSEKTNRVITTVPQKNAPWG